MSSSVSRHPLSPLTSLYPQNRLPDLPEHLGNWWRESPVLSRGKTCAHIPGVSLPTLPDKIVLGAAPKIRAVWDRRTIAIKKKLAFPAIIGGLIFTIVGVSACATIVSGIHIPGMEFILKNIPVSIAFSLTLVRGGIHALNHGIMASRQNNRSRQETVMALQQLRIQEGIGALSDIERGELSLEVVRLDKRLPPSLSIKHTLAEGAYYSKARADIKPHYADPFLKKISEIFGAPPLEAPTTEPTLEANPRSIVDTSLLKPPKSRYDRFWNAFYDYFNSKQTALGVFDIGVGQFMLFSAFVGIVFLLFPGLLPSGLEIFVNDPYLSLPFALLLLGHWISCTRTGWRMLDYNKREIKRENIAEDLQMVALGLEKCRVEALCHWIREELTKLSRTSSIPGDQLQLQQYLSKINEAEREFIQSLPWDRIHKAKAERIQEAPKGCLAPSLHRFGKRVVPSLATPSIIIGLIVTFMGLACLGMAVSGTIPAVFELLTKNTSLSIIFATSLLVVGLTGIYRGASISDFNDKQKLKGDSIDYRRHLLHNLFYEGPEDPQSKTDRLHLFLTGRPAIIAPKEVARAPVSFPAVVTTTMSPTASSKSKQVQDALKEYQDKLTKRKGWFGFWINVTGSKPYWISQCILGSFLLAASIVGLLMVMGVASPPDFFSFVAKDPSASATFFFSLLVIGCDALSNFWRMKTYKERKGDDRKQLDVLAECTKKLFPRLAVPAVSVFA